MLTAYSKVTELFFSHKIILGRHLENLSALKNEKKLFCFDAGTCVQHTISIYLNYR